MEEIIQPELKDIDEMIARYCAANKGKVCVIASFWAADENKLDTHEEDITKEGSDRLIAFGYIEPLRMSLNELRNLIEDNKDEDGFVNI